MITYEQIKNRLIQLGGEGTAPARVVDIFGQVANGHDDIAVFAAEPEIGADDSMSIGWLATEYTHAGAEWSVGVNIRAKEQKGGAVLDLDIVRADNLTEGKRYPADELRSAELYAALSAITRRLAGEGGDPEDYAPGAPLTVPRLVVLEALERAVYAESVISLKVRGGMDAVLLSTYAPADGANTIVDTVCVTADAYTQCTFGNDIDPEEVDDIVLRNIRHRLQGVAGALAGHINH